MNQQKQHKFRVGEFALYSPDNPADIHLAFRPYINQPIKILSDNRIMIISDGNIFFTAFNATVKPLHNINYQGQYLFPFSE